MSLRATSKAPEAPGGESRLSHVLAVGSLHDAKLVPRATPPRAAPEQTTECIPSPVSITRPFHKGSMAYATPPEAPKQAIGCGLMVVVEKPPEVGDWAYGVTPVALTRNLKVNSGSLEEWKTISSDNVVQLTTAEAPKIYDRDGTMTMLQNALGGQEVDKGMPLKLMEKSKQFYKTEDSPALLGKESPKVIMVKMWGFSGMHDAEEMFSHYANGVDALFKMDDFTRDLGKGAQVVLHFDGDFAYEKDNNLFSHNLFAPFVANRIKRKARVHLVITKVKAYKDDDALKDIVNKFRNDDSSIRTSIVAGRHCHPYFDRRFFNSCALYVSNPVNSPYSEGQNSEMMEKLFDKDKVLSRFCLCIGGNTKDKSADGIEKGGGFMSMKQYIEKGNAVAFNGAVRVNVTATK